MIVQTNINQQRLHCVTPVEYNKSNHSKKFPDITIVRDQSLKLH